MVSWLTELLRRAAQRERIYHTPNSFLVTLILYYQPSTHNLFAKGAKKLRSDYLNGGIYLKNELKAISVVAKVSSQIIKKPEILHRHLLQNGITDVCFLRKAWAGAFASIFYLTLNMSRRKSSGYDLASFPSSTAFFSTLSR